MRLAFREFDKDGDGMISLDELRAVLREHDIPWEDAEDLVQKLDKNNDGNIDYYEFEAYLTERQAKKE
jgi:calmodulin